MWPKMSKKIFFQIISILETARLVHRQSNKAVNCFYLLAGGPRDWQPRDSFWGSMDKLSCKKALVRVLKAGGYKSHFPSSNFAQIPFPSLLFFQILKIPVPVLLFFHFFPIPSDQIPVPVTQIPVTQIPLSQ